MTKIIELRHYVDRSGRDIFDHWLSKLADTRTQAKIAARINRIALGNFGDCRSLGKGLHELRIDWGPGYRIYYVMMPRSTVLILCGGDKSTQAGDIAKAESYLSDYKTRTEKQ